MTAGLTEEEAFLGAFNCSGGVPPSSSSSASAPPLHRNSTALLNTGSRDWGKRLLLMSRDWRVSRTTAILSLIELCAKNADLVVYGPSLVIFPGNPPGSPGSPGSPG